MWINREKQFRERGRSWNITLPIEIAAFEMRKLKISANSRKIQMIDVWATDIYTNYEKSEISGAESWHFIDVKFLPINNLHTATINR